ncbi:MAG: nucleotide exchange factor GrpE [Candidatus Omnitrophota bacterium]
MMRGKEPKGAKGDNAGGEKKIDEKELAELRRKAAERDDYYSKWLTVHAEYENTRRRMEKEKAEHIRFANEDIMSQLFLIADSFDRAFEAMDKAEDKKAVMDGIKMIQKEFHKILEDYGVRKIETEGKMFDPHFHEAVFAVETTEHPDGVILGEVRPGYMLNDRLLRASQVKVAKNEEEQAEAREEPAEEEQTAPYMDEEED